MPSLDQQAKSAGQFVTRPLREFLVCCLVLVTWPLSGITAEQTAAPVVEFQVVLARDRIERDEVVTLFLLASNKSNLPITLSRINLLSDAFAQERKDFSLPIGLAPFGTAQGTISLRACSNARFGAQKLVITADYLWPNDPQEVLTTQSITLPLELIRRFEEEAKGFPGGTAAFLYLLLPVIPAFLSYQILDGLRKGESLRVPEFKTEYVAPAFLAAIVISFLMLAASSSDAAINYSDPAVFIRVLFTSLIVGAVVPSIRWLRSWMQMRRWGFSRNEGEVSYLRKALLGPRSPEQFEWVTGMARGETWQGFLLRQPNGKLVLGPQVTVSPKTAAAAAFTGDKLTNAKLLVRLAEANQVKVQLSEAVLRGGTQLRETVVDGLEDFQQTDSSTAKEFVRSTT